MAETKLLYSMGLITYRHDQTYGNKLTISNVDSQ